MKTIIIPVRKEFACPSLYSHDDNMELKETALLIGAYAVSYFSESNSSKTVETQRLQKASSDRCKSLLTQLETLQSQFDVKIKDEKDKLRQELLDSVKLEVQIKEREKFLSEKELLIEKLDKKYQKEIDVKNEEKKEIRKEFEALRSEHDGLVMKLMTRLETSSVRSGASSATLGRSFEENIEKHLRQVFGARKGFELIDVHSQGHSGDFILIFDNLRILIELKSYDPKTKVPTKEVEKLARDLSEIEPKCNAAIMISACSEITGHYTCGPLEVSSEVACVPVLFINNFLAMGDPLVTLHMIKVFLMMVTKNLNSKGEEDEIGSDDDDLKRINIECARRCTGYLTDLNKQSSELLKQISVMKNSITKLKECIITFIETEVSRFNGIILLTSRGVVEKDEDHKAMMDLDRSVFSVNMTEENKKMAISISENFCIGNHDQTCLTKDMIQFIQKDKEISDKNAREIMKNIFLETVVKHGYLSGVMKK